MTKLQRLEKQLEQRRGVLRTSDRWMLAKTLEHLVLMRTKFKADAKRLRSVTAR